MNSLLKIAVLAAVVAAQCTDSCPPSHATEGASPATYAHRIFHDFRNLDETGSLYQGEPANITTDAESAAAPVQEGYLTSDAFVRDWGIQTWGSPVSEDSPVRKQYSNQNVYIQTTDDSTHLVLRAYRNDDFISAAELDTKLSNILHASIRLRARVHGDPGACAGFFTYFDNKNESDIEILTRDPTDHLRYTNQPGVDDEGNEIPEASSDVVMPGGAVWTEWNEHRLDWTEGLSLWYLNGAEVVRKTYSVPTEPSSVILNLWGDGGSWSGEMEVGAAAYLEIEWIEILYNTSDA
ncbi:glycoside hydrolase family 16 protein [Aspergillus lucknowensis]|uniref:Concanavalin A-like lectin/glucanase domain-containing protein n=1 Tax=Aspergillus lucknowensis TaxID=176173 RepID=A0ABR4LFN2_9EURO